jgi:hypothetical protein
MAHFAQIDENNTVINVLVVPDEQQHRGAEYLSNDLQLGGRWIQTSYNSNIRKRFAGINFTYNEELDVFLPPKPFDSWVLNTELAEWVAPIEKPQEIEGTGLSWNEQEQTWERNDLPVIEPESE